MTLQIAGDGVVAWQLFDEAPVFMCVLEGPELRITRINRCLRETPQGPQLLGKTGREIYGADNPLVVAAERVFATGQPDTVHAAPTYLADNPRAPRFFTRHFAPLRDEHGAVTAVLAVGYEVTEEVRARLAHAESEQRNRAELERVFELLEEAPAIMAALEPPDWRIVFANRKLRELSGSHLGVGSKLRDLLAPSNPTLIALDRAYATGHIEVFEAEGQLEGLLGRAFSVTVVPIHGRGGHVARAMISSIEITEQRRARAALEAQARDLDHARREAVEAGRAKDQFLAMLGHELRNPLQPILTAVQVMRLDGTSSPALDMIERQIRYLTVLVDDLLDISRISRGMVVLKREPVELVTIVNRALEMSSPLLEQKSHRVVCDLMHRGLAVSADTMRLAQVVANLIQNAAKYSEPGSQIRIAARRDADRAVLEVSDEGVGIPADMLDRVFDAFVQQPQTRDHSGGGLGLGLAIVKGLVDAHGGRVAARSEGRGRGSTFSVELPALEPELDLACEDAAPSRPVRHASHPLRILVVDDNHEAAEILKIALSGLGHEIAIAYDAPAALELARSYVPQLALVDIGLPVMDGYRLGSLLRQAYGIPIVAVTGYGQVTDHARSREAGFSAHLVKPVDLGELTALIGELARDVVTTSSPKA